MQQIKGSDNDLMNEVRASKKFNATLVTRDLLLNGRLP